MQVKAILAKSYARIHESNLVNFGIVPLRFTNPADYDSIEAGDELEVLISVSQSARVSRC